MVCVRLHVQYALSKPYYYHYYRRPSQTKWRVLHTEICSTKQTLCVLYFKIQFVSYFFGRFYFGGLKIFCVEKTRRP